ELDYVVGVDTHRDEHVLAVVAAATGAVLARQVVPANERGYQAALRFAGEAAHGARAWAVEGTGSYGAGLARYLADRGETVLEVSRTPRSERRLRGKDDALDAVRTARAALASEALALPRNGERREALRLLLVARRSAVDVRREALGQLRGVIVTAPDRLREELRVLPTGGLLERCSRLRRSSGAGARRARDTARAAQPRLPNRGSNRRSGRARTGDPRPRTRTRARAARRAGRRPDRRRATARRLVAPRPAALRGRLRPPRRRRPAPRFKRPDGPPPSQPWRRPPTQPRPAHRRPAPPPTRPGNQGLHRTTDRRRQEPPRGHPAAQALSRPPPLPATAKPGAASGLTGHRSFIPQHWHTRRPLGPKQKTPTPFGSGRFREIVVAAARGAERLHESPDERQRLVSDLTPAAVDNQ